MKKTVTFIFCCIVICLAVACNQKKKTMDDLQDLTEQVEKKGAQYSRENWEDVYNKYTEISDRITQQKYSNEELRTIGRLKMRFFTACAKQGCNTFGNMLNNFFQQSVGAGEEINDQLKGIEQDISAAAENTLDEMPDEALQELEKLFE